MSVITGGFQSLVGVALPPMPQPQLWRLSVEQYHAMIRHGILTEEDDVELLDGILVAKMTKSTAHSVAILLVQNCLAKCLPAGWFVDVQDATTLSTSEPEPDLMVVRGEPRDYVQRHPRPRDVALLIEVSDSSLRYDQGDKKLTYAADAIAVYWIVNLVDRRVEVYTDPSDPGPSGSSPMGPGERPDYRQRRDLDETDLVPVVIAGREVARIQVSELLP